MPPKTPSNTATVRSNHFKHDLLASVVVFLVALPLCMGIAIASGVPVAAGLITGIVGGLVVGALAGSPLQVSGPAAGLTVIIYAIVQEHGLHVLGVAVLLGGALQFVAGIFKLGQWFRAVSPAVIQGMLAGIGVLIFSSQFHVMVDDAPKESGVQNLLTIPEAIRKGLPLPTFGTAEERRFRTQKLKQIGMLHEEQQEIQEAVAEHVSEHPVGDEAALQAAGLAPLIEWQQTHTTRLNIIIEELQAHQSAENSRNSAQLLAAAKLARDRSREALAQLQRDTQAGAVELAANRRGLPVAAARATQQEAVAALENLLGSLKNHDWAAKIGLLTIGLILLWQGLMPKSLKLVPAPLVAVVAATSLAAIFVLPVLYVEVPDNLLDGLHFPSLTALQSVPLSAIVEAAFVIAVVASAETLLCATAVDAMHAGPRTKYDRELAAQGLGNMICGFFGGLPMTGVIVRSATNVQAGGRTRLSAVLHGLWLLVFVVFLAFLLRMIPTAALAAILVYTGYKLVNPKSIQELWKIGWGEVVVYAATVGTIVVVDLLTGVLVGITLSGLKLLYNFSHLKLRLETETAGDRIILTLQGAATFLRLPKLASTLEQVPQGADLHVDLTELDYIDHACLNLLTDWGKQHETTGGRLLIDWNSLHATFNRKRIAGAVAETSQSPTPKLAKT